MDPTDAALLAEIDQHARKRRHGVWLAAVFAALFALLLPYSLRMMHGPGLTKVDGRIVEVGFDAERNEKWMVSEFTDSNGVVHRDRETDGYHYAPGDPQVGQRIAYAYRYSEQTGDVVTYVRADVLLQWVFGVPAAFLGALALVLAWHIARQRALRRRLVRSGRREKGQAPAIRHRQFAVQSQVVRAWRIEASWFEPTRTQFVLARSDWQSTPAPDVDPKSLAPLILVDAKVPSRHWLPIVAALPHAPHADGTNPGAA